MKKFLRDEWIVFKTEYKKIFFFVTFITIAVFALSFFIGYTQYPEESVKHIAERRAAATEFGKKPAFERFFDLTSHNLIQLMKTVSFGLIPIVILPLIVIVNTFSNLALHYVTTYLEGGSILQLALFRFGPHGLVETLSMIMAATLGIHLSLTILKSRNSFFKKETWLSIYQHSLRYLKSFLLLIFPLVVLAGLLEGFVTPWIASFFYK